MERNFLTYAEFKNICSSKNIGMQYQDLSQDTYKEYSLTACDSFIIYLCKINNTDHASDVSDFENNYKDNSNQTITNPVSIENGNKYLKYKNDFTTKNLSCNNSTWTEFYDINFTPDDKHFDEIIIIATNNHKFKIEIDGEEIINAGINDLEDLLIE